MDDRLQKFAQLADSGSFTQAAHALHISQPALTLAITKLERELQATLLIRSNRKLDLTAAGRLAYETAKEQRTLHDNMLAGLSEMAHARPTITLGMVDSVAAIVCSAAQPLQQLQSDADVSIVVDNSRNLRQAVIRRSTDIAIVVHDDATQLTAAVPSIMTRVIGDEPLVVVCHPDRFKAIEAVLHRGQLPHFICYDQSSLTCKIIHRSLQQQNIEPQPVFFSTSPDVILQMVLLGKGIAALPYSMCHQRLEDGALTMVKRTGLTITIKRPIALLALNAKILPSSLQVFSEQATTLLRASWQVAVH